MEISGLWALKKIRNFFRLIKITLKARIADNRMIRPVYFLQGLVGRRESILQTVKARKQTGNPVESFYPQGIRLAHPCMGAPFRTPHAVGHSALQSADQS
jgi:hypothetical protein